MATSTNPRTRDVLIRALGSAADLRVEETRHRGHATLLGRTAVADGYDIAVALGGDGTINELVNGMLESAGPRPGPDLAVIPGGSANVFARDLGLPRDPVEATGQVLEALREGRRRKVSLGHASWSGPAPGSRYFIFCAGLGFDAEVVRSVEGLRGAGFKASTLLYATTAVRHYFRTDRRRPPLRLELHPKAINGVFMAIVSNVSPWTYLGSRPVRPTPYASFDAGLDVLGLRGLGLFTMLRTLHHVTKRGPARTARGRNLVNLHDEVEFTISSYRPVAFQLDGDYLGEQERITFRSIPSALQTVV